MAHLTIADAASRTTRVAKKWRQKADFHPGGEKGKLHRELGISTSKTIPAGRLEAATHSKDPEVRRDAIRAKTMKGWNHKRSPLHDHPRSNKD
jgi:hypothetical protein